MVVAETPRQQGAHLSELVFDRLLAGEGQGLADARKHLDTCADCREKLDVLRAEQQVAMQQLPQRVDRLMRAVEGKGSESAGEAGIGARLWQWLQGAVPTSVGVRGVAAVAVAVALVWIFVPRGVDEQLPGRDAVRLKGFAGTFEVLWIQGDRATVLDPRDRLSPGARLGFRAHCPAGCWALLMVLDGEGRPAILQGQEPGPWKMSKSAEPTVLPVQVELDQSGTEERFVALLCREKPSPKEAVVAVARHYERAKAGAARGENRAAPLPDGCVLRKWVVMRRGGASGVRSHP